MQNLFILQMEMSGEKLDNLSKCQKMRHINSNKATINEQQNLIRPNTGMHK